MQLPDGGQFSVGTGFSDAQRESPPPIGSVITFRYQELTDGGVPRFPSFVRVLSAPAESSVADQPAKKSKSKAATRQTQPATAQGDSVGARRFELVDGKSAKFWEITRSGSNVTVRYGRIGTQGQSNEKTFADDDAADRHAEKLIAEKTKKGYEEVSADE